jgi:hypothetical protein
LSGSWSLCYRLINPTEVHNCQLASQLGKARVLQMLSNFGERPQSYSHTRHRVPSAASLPQPSGAWGKLQQSAAAKQSAAGFVTTNQTIYKRPTKRDAIMLSSMQGAGMRQRSANISASACNPKQSAFARAARKSNVRTPFADVNIITGGTCKRTTSQTMTMERERNGPLQSLEAVRGPTASDYQPGVTAYVHVPADVRYSELS